MNKDVRLILEAMNDGEISPAMKARLSDIDVRHGISIKDAKEKVHESDRELVEYLDEVGYTRVRDFGATLSFYKDWEDPRYTEGMSADEHKALDPNAGHHSLMVVVSQPKDNWWSKNENTVDHTRYWSFDPEQWHLDTKRMRVSKDETIDTVKKMLDVIRDMIVDHESLSDWDF